MGDIPQVNLLLHQANTLQGFLRERIGRLEERVQDLEDKNDSWLRELSIAAISAIIAALCTKLLQ